MDAKSEIDNPQIENIQIEYTEIQNAQIEKSKSRRKIIEKSDSESGSFDIVSDSMLEIGNSELIDSVKKFIPVQNKSPEIDLCSLNKSKNVSQNQRLVTKIGRVKRGPGRLWIHAF